MLPNTQPAWMGVTRPFSLDEPTPDELAETENIVRFLQFLKNFPDEAEKIHREEVLARLYHMILEFVKTVGKQLGYSTLADRLGCKLFTSGSYRLDVNDPGADIDTIVVLPQCISIKHFFEDFVAVLRQVPEVEHLTPVRGAVVPVIKMIFDGIDIDLIYAPLSRDIIPPDLNVLDLEILRGVSSKTQKALGGPRVAEQILQLVHNEDAFRIALRLIRVWAKNRGIYSNVHGYLGGIHCNILVARICQLFPHKSASTIVRRFFQVYGKIWVWPSPVMLKRIERHPELPFEVWDQSVKAGRHHMMPIITPAYPSMCATHNVNESTFRTMMAEFERAEKIVEVESEGVYDHDTFSRLVEEVDFFIRYKTYLQIEVPALDGSSLDMWHGFVQSKCRLFVQFVDRLLKNAMRVHVFPAYFNHPLNGSVIPELMKTGVDRLFRRTMYLGLTFLIPAMHVNLAPPIARFHGIVNGWDQKTTSMLPVTITKLKRSQIPQWVLSPDMKRAFLRRRRRDRKEREQRDAETMARKRQREEEVKAEVPSESESSPEESPKPPPSPSTLADLEPPTKRRKVGEDGTRVEAVRPGQGPKGEKPQLQLRVLDDEDETTFGLSRRNVRPGAVTPLEAPKIQMQFRARRM